MQAADTVALSNLEVNVATDTDLELQRLLELSRATREMQQAQLQRTSPADSPLSASAGVVQDSSSQPNGRAGARTPPSTANGRTPPPPTRTPPSAGGSRRSGAASSSRQGATWSGKTSDEERPRPPPVPQRQQGLRNVTPLRGSNVDSSQQRLSSNTASPAVSSRRTPSRLAQTPQSPQGSTAGSGINSNASSVAAPPASVTTDTTQLGATMVGAQGHRTLRDVVPGIPWADSLRDGFSSAEGRQPGALGATGTVVFDLPPPTDGEVEAEASEPDMSWEQELRSNLAAQLREMETRRRAAEKRAGNAQQALRRLNLEQGKFDKQIKKELTEAEAELEAVEKKASGQGRALRLAIDKAEAALDAARSDRHEAEHSAALAENTKRSELQELYDQRDREERLNAELIAETDIVRSQHVAVEELLQKRLTEVAMERAEIQQVEVSINKAEEVLEEQLQSEFTKEASLLREQTTSGCMARCRGLVEILDVERARADSLEADVQRESARLQQMEAELAGFQEAVDISVEASTEHLRKELAGLLKEESLAVKHLEALAKQHAQSASRVLQHPSATGGVDINTLKLSAQIQRRSKLHETTEAVVAELKEHQDFVMRLFEESSKVAKSASAACAFQLSGGSPSRNSSALTSPQSSSPWRRGAAATSLFAMPLGGELLSGSTMDAFPWVQHQASPVMPPWPWPSSSSNSLADRGSAAGSPGSLQGLAGLADRMPTSLANANEMAARRFDEVVSSGKAQIENLRAEQDAERQALEASAHGLQCSVSATAAALRKKEASRLSEEVELLRLQSSVSVQPREAKDFNNVVALRASLPQAEARASAAEDAAVAAEAAHAAVAKKAAAVSSAQGSLGGISIGACKIDTAPLEAALREGKELPVVSPGTLLAYIAQLEVDLAEMTQEEEALQRRGAAVAEVCELREAEAQASREVAAASSELEDWQRSLQASGQNLHNVHNDRHRLNALRSEVEEEERLMQRFCRDEKIAESEHRTWASSLEAALQAKAEAAHIANIEALMALDIRLDREANLRSDLERLNSTRESWEKISVGEVTMQSSLTQSAALRTSEGNELQLVYANRAKEVERLYSKHGEMLNEHRQLQAELAAARADLRSTSVAFEEARNREVNEAAGLRSELFAQESLERDFARASQASSAASVRYSREMAVFQGECRQYQLMEASVGHVLEEQRKLRDEIVAVREESARGWRRLDEEEANHMLHAEQLDERRREQAAEATAAATAAASDAIEAMRVRVAATASQRGAAKQHCDSLASELREAEQNCASLRRLLERSEQSREQPRDRLQRSLASLSPIVDSEPQAEDDPEGAAELAKAQAASREASEAAFQSAGAVGVAEEEVSKLLNRLLAARAECSERAQGLTLAAEGVERTRMDHRRAESELEVVQHEISVLQKGGDDSNAGGDGSEATIGLAERARRTETLPREQMILMQQLRGSQRGGGPGSSGNGALEALRNLREQQLHQASKLKAEEDLICAQLQHKVEEAAREAACKEQLLQRELEAAVLDREQLLALVENGQEARHTSEQQLRWAIHCLQNSPEASPMGSEGAMEPIDDDMVARMGTVMREAQRFLYEQQARLDAVLQERDEVKSRLLDTLAHLKGPEYAELVVDTASRAAASDGGTSEVLQLGTRRSRSRSPIPCNLPPTIVEEEEPTSARIHPSEG